MKKLAIGSLIGLSLLGIAVLTWSIRPVAASSRTYIEDGRVHREEHIRRFSILRSHQLGFGEYGSVGCGPGEFTVVRRGFKYGLFSVEDVSLYEVEDNRPSDGTRTPRKGAILP